VFGKPAQFLHGLPNTKKCVSEREPDEEGSSLPLAQTPSSNQLLITEKRKIEKKKKGKNSVEP
jgi:hypothetical protein